MVLPRLLVVWLGLSVVLVEIAIAQQPLAEVTESSPIRRLRKVQLGSMKPVTVFGDVYLAGQPAPSDLALFKTGGIQTIISLRLAKEIAWDEAVAVDQAGMKFVHVPFQRPEQLKPEIFDKVIKVLRDKRRGPTVLHCGSANRVGAIWYAYRVLDGQLSPEEARKEAQAVGLRTPAYLEKAQEYVEAVQKKKAESQAPSSSAP